MHSSDLTADRNHLIEWCLFMLVAVASENWSSQLYFGEVVRIFRDS